MITLDDIAEVSEEIKKQGRFKPDTIMGHCGHATMVEHAATFHDGDRYWVVCGECAQAVRDGKIQSFSVEGVTIND